MSCAGIPSVMATSAVWQVTPMTNADRPADGVRLGVAFPHGDPGFATGTDAILAFDRAGVRA